MGNITIQGDLTGDVPGGEVGGASNLTTVGAIPYVSAAGILNQDPTALFWDAANNRLGIGTATPSQGNIVSAISVAASAPFGGPTQVNFASINLDPSVNNWVLFANLSSSGVLASGFGSQIVNQSLHYGDMAWFTRGSGGFGERFRLSSTGNLLIGTTTDSNFKLDVASSGTSGTARFYGGAGVSDSTKVVVQAGGGQTGSLIEIQTSGGVIVGTMSTAGISMPSVASDGNLVGVTHQVTNTGRIEFSNGSFYSQSIRRRSDDIIAFDNNTAIGTTPGNARDVMLRGVYAAETTSDPSAADLSIAGANAQDTFRLYMKNDKLVVAYQISGTVNYLTIPLDGATTTWTQSTTAP